MSAELPRAMITLADRLLALLASDDQLRAGVRAVARAVLDATEGDTSARPAATTPAAPSRRDEPARRAEPSPPGAVRLASRPDPAEFRPAASPRAPARRADARPAPPARG